MIDLHLHTTASDGRLTAAELVARAAAAGITVMSVTDHDTVAAVEEATRLAAPFAIRVVPGIEITAVHGGRDFHVLAYFVDHLSPSLAAFLQRQRAQRVDRVREIAARLAALGMPVNTDDILAQAAATPGTSVGRPLVAKALKAAGYVASIDEAFERFLGPGRPGFVPRTGSPPAEVVEIIHDSGGLASMAHPGVTRKDEMIAPLVEAGLDALEVFHSDHSPEARAMYRETARRMGLAITGGSDFHGYGATRDTLGAVHLPGPDFDALEARVPS